MRKILLSFAALMLCGSVSAFSLKDAVSSVSVEDVVTTVATTLFGDAAVTTSNLAGTWNYSNPAVKLESDNTLTEAAGTLLTSQVETKLTTLFTKVGVTSSSFSFTFGSDMSFSCTTSSKSLSGTYTIDGDEILTLTFSALGAVDLGSISTTAIISGSSLSLLFPIDKLLDIISALSSSSDNSTIQALSSTLSNYDGLSTGFELTK